MPYLQGIADSGVPNCDGGMSHLQGKVDSGVHGFLGEADGQVSVETRVVESAVRRHLELVRSGPEGDNEGAHPVNLQLHARLRCVVLTTRKWEKGGGRPVTGSF